MKHITTDALRRLHDREGLIIQGCGDSLDGWVTDISDIFTKEGILLDGDTFKEVSAFEHEGLTNLFFSLERVKLDWEKLTAWLKSDQSFDGMWLSDYVPDKLGDFIIEKELPDCPLIGADGNIFNLMGIASRTLKDNGMKKEADEMRQRVMDSGNYNNALCIIGEYVNITSVDDDEDFDEDEDYYEGEEQGMGGIT